MRLIHPIDTSVFAGDPMPQIREDFGRRMTEWVRPYSQEVNTIQLDMMYAYKMTGHFGLYGPAFGAYGLVQSPLAFRPVFNAMTSIHWRHRNGHGLLRQMIERLDPRIAAIETTSGGPAQPMRVTNFHRFFPYYADVGVRALNKITEKAFGRSWFGGTTAALPLVQSAKEAGVLSLRNGISGQSESGLLKSAAFYDRSRLDEFLRQALQPDFGEVSLLGRIVTVELALRATETSLDV